MLKIINLPTGNTIAEYANQRDAEAYLSTFETNPATHEIVGTEEPAGDVAE